MVGPARRNQVNNHQSGNALPGRHTLFVPDFRNILDDPLPLIVSNGSWLEIGMIQPDGLVLPTRRKLERIAGFSNRHSFLEEPFILKNVGPPLTFDFEADNVAGLGGGDREHFDAKIGDEFSALDVTVTAFGGVFVFHFEIFSLGGDAPAV